MGVGFLLRSLSFAALIPSPGSDAEVRPLRVGKKRDHYQEGYFGQAPCASAWHHFIRRAVLPPLSARAEYYTEGFALCCHSSSLMAMEVVFCCGVKGQGIPLIIQGDHHQ